jgi:hypothetical protein
MAGVLILEEVNTFSVAVTHNEQIVVILPDGDIRKR